MSGCPALPQGGAPPRGSPQGDRKGRPYYTTDRPAKLVYSRGGACGIDSNKIEKAHQLSRFLGLGPLPRLALALGVARLLTRLQGLWRRHQMEDEFAAWRRRIDLLRE